MVCAGEGAGLGRGEATVDCSDLSELFARGDLSPGVGTRSRGRLSRSGGLPAARAACSRGQVPALGKLRHVGALQGACGPRIPPKSPPTPLIAAQWEPGAEAAGLKVGPGDGKGGSLGVKRGPWGRGMVS